MSIYFSVAISLFFLLLFLVLVRGGCENSVRLCIVLDCVGFLVHYGNGALKHVISTGHILWVMWGGKVIKVMPWARVPLITSRVVWLWWPSSIVTRRPWMLLLWSWMFQPEHKHLCLRPPITNGVTHWLWRSSTYQSISTLFLQTEK